MPYADENVKQGRFRGHCAVCGNRFKVGDTKIANLYEQDSQGVRREYCESCYWGANKGESKAGAFKKVEHNAYMKYNDSAGLTSRGEQV